MTAAMELLHPASCLLLLLLLFLLTRPGVTSADNNGPVKVKVTEGDDVVLHCSLRQTDLHYELFFWKKDDQQEVFLYNGGLHYNNGHTGQDPQFKDRVSHFADELQHGNASIKIRNTKVEDSGNYSCIFPHLKNQIFHIELVVDPVIVKVKEGDDVVLPCSLRQTNLTGHVFDWTKVKDNEDKTQKEVFLYDAGNHYNNNGRTGQDPPFKGRVSHFEDELKHGNASIKIRNTKLEDRGKYKCIFPNLQNQIFHIELVVDPVLKKRNTKGAVPEPSLTTIEHTADRALLQCSVKGASPKSTVQWKNSAGEVLSSVVTDDPEVNKHFDITLQTNVAQTGNYSCVVTQADIGHQVSSVTFVRLDPAVVVVTKGSDAVLPCSLRQTDLNYVVFDWKKDDQKEVFLYHAGDHYNNDRLGQDPQFKGRVSHFQDELKHGNASIKIRNTQLEDSGDYSCYFPRLHNQIFHIKLVVGDNTGLIAGWTVAAVFFVLFMAVVVGFIVYIKRSKKQERSGGYDAPLE